MIVTTSFYLRENELPAGHPDFTEPSTKNTGLVKAASENTRTGYNYLNPAFLRGMKIVSYKLERRGSRYFFSVTFSNEDVSRSFPGSQAVRNMFRHLTSNANLWQVAVYHNEDETIGVACRERQNYLDNQGMPRFRKSADIFGLLP